MSQAEVYRSYAEPCFRAEWRTSDTEPRARRLGMAQAEQRKGSGSEQTLTEAMALIESMIQELGWNDSGVADYRITVETPTITPTVKIKNWDRRVGLPVLLIASIMSASLVYGILFVL